jgi:hypothetical protein
MSNVGVKTDIHSKERETIYNLYKFILGEAKDAINFPSEDTGSEQLPANDFSKPIFSRLSREGEEFVAGISSSFSVAEIAQNTRRCDRRIRS